MTARNLNAKLRIKFITGILENMRPSLKLSNFLFNFVGFRFFGIMDSKYTYILEEHYRNIKRQKEIEDSLAMEPEISLTNVRQIDPENIETTSNEK